MIRLPSIRVMQKAFTEKDPAFNGTFFVAVKTTGIFCRPVCRAKTPRAENVEFFANAREAIRAGYRACKLCKPLEPPDRAPLVKQLVELAERKQGRVTEKDLRAAGIEPTTARRQFRAAFKTTFSVWQRSHRLGRAIHTIQNGANMTTAQLEAGFESASGFRDALAKLNPRPNKVTSRDGNGATATASRSKTRSLTVAARAGRVLTAEWISSPLGPMLAVASDAGLVMLDFVDNRGFETAALRMKRKLGECTIVPGEHRYLSKLKNELAEYFAGARKNFTVPLQPRGTEFELRVWEYLRKIPYGETRTYGQQARAIGKPEASRAVGAANGRNDLSILIPCHRVIGASGSLVGYGGGLQRKRWLLDHERRIAGAELF